MKALSEREQEVMNIIWELRNCCVEDVVSRLPDDPKPAYTTVQTFMRILEQKEFLAHKREGKKFIFYPLIEKPEYTRWSLKHMKDNLFGGSAKSLLNTFIRDTELSQSDISDLMLLLKELKETP
jgi:predicted transcriptional regulator